MAVLALTIAGQALGSYLGGIIGYAALGGAIGGAVGGYLGQSLTAKDISNVGPRLEDLSAIKIATEGSDISQLYGDCRVQAQFIVAQALTEHEHVSESGGKGGPTVTTTTYTYTDTFAVAFGEPRLGAGKFRKIWHNKKIVEDYSVEADATSSGAIATFYDGTQTTPDPDLESLIGIGNVPAYKGIAYGVYVDLELSEYGNRPPTVEAEIVINGTISNNTTDTSVGDPRGSGGMMMWSEANNTLFASFIPSLALDDFYVVQFEPESQKVINTLSLGTYPTSRIPYLFSSYGDTNLHNRLFVHDLSDNYIYIYEASTFDLITSFEGKDTSLATIGSATRILSESKYHAMLQTTNGLYLWDKSNTDITFITSSGLQATNNANAIWADGHFIVSLKNSSTSKNEWAAYYPSLGTWSSPVVSTSFVGTLAYVANAMVADRDGYIWVLGNGPSNHPTLTKLTSDPQEVAHYDLVDYGAAAHSVGGSGYPCLQYSDVTNSLYFHYYGYTWEFDLTKLELNSYADSGGGGSSWAYPQMENGVVWGGSNNISSHATIRRYRLNTVTPVDVDLADIATDICNQANISSSFIDTSSWTSTVGGYTNTRQGSAKASLTPLLTIGLGYMTNSDWTLKFLPLGEAEVDTIDANDLGAREIGSDPIIPLDIREPDSTLLPRKAQINYISSDGDLQPAMAEAENYNAIGNTIINLSFPAVLADADAATLVQTTLQLSSEAITYTFSLPRKYGALDAGDNIFLPTAQGNVRCRLTKVDRGVNGVINFNGQSDSQENLIAVATAGANNASTGTIASSSPAQIIYLDLPLLQDSNGNHPGPYLTAYTYGSGFPGAAFYQSTDDQTYTEISGIVSEPAVFTCETVPSTVDFESWDDTNTIRVTAVTDDTLSSTTESNLLLNLANAAAWGRPGRWEVVQFGTATLVSDGVYDLSHLLRGRRGTDNFMDSHVDGDLFVILSTSSLVRHTLSNSDIGTTRYYKAPLFGKYLADAIKTEVTIGDVPLTPYSPHNISVSDNSTTWQNKDIVWDWRTRYGGVYGGPSSLTDGSLGTNSDLDTGDLRILDASGTVLNTYNVSSGAYTYTETNIISDYGSLPVNIYFQIAQDATTAGVGLGYWTPIYTYFIGFSVLRQFSSSVPFSLTDNFDTTIDGYQDDSTWNRGYGLSSISGGTATINSDPQRLGSTYLLTGDFDISLKWAINSGWDTNGDAFMMRVTNSNSESRTIYREYNSQRITGTDGTTYNYSTLNWSSGYFRIARVDSTITLYYKQNLGDSWIVRGTYSDFTYSKGVRLYVFTLGATEFLVDYITMNSDSEGAAFETTYETQNSTGTTYDCQQKIRNSSGTVFNL